MPERVDRHPLLIGNANAHSNDHGSDQIRLEFAHPALGGQGACTLHRRIPGWECGWTGLWVPEASGGGQSTGPSGVALTLFLSDEVLKFDYATIDAPTGKSEVKQPEVPSFVSISA